MNVLAANLAGVKLEDDGSIRHYAKAGSRWPMTVGRSRTVDYYPFPFWLAYATALLKRDTKTKVTALDGVVLDYTADEMLQAVTQAKPDLLLTELTALTAADDLAFLARAKAATGCLVVLAGVYPTAEGENIMRACPAVDFVAFGEYELTVLDLVQALEAGRSPAGIPGLIARDASGAPVKGQSRPLMDDLDMLPYPDRDDFPPTVYFDFAFHSPCVNLVSSRGCPCGCVYCTERHVVYASPRYRPRNPARVVDEMEHCARAYGARQFYFDDQSFVVRKDHVLAICAEISTRGLKIPWTCMGDAMFVDRETLQAMAEAGCIGMKFGVESADPAILKGIGKPLDLDKARQVARWCRELGITSHATFCLGLPGETEQTAAATLAYMETLDVDLAQVSRAVPYPGTPFFTWANEHGYLSTRDLSLFDGAGASVLDYPGLSGPDIDRWYARFLRRVSRKKLRHYLTRPRESFSILAELLRKKGPLGLLRSVVTFARRAA